jgi:hypothetical protein
MLDVDYGGAGGDEMVHPYTAVTNRLISQYICCLLLAHYIYILSSHLSNSFQLNHYILCSLYIDVVPLRLLQRG